MSEIEAKAELYDQIVQLVLGRLLKANAQAEAKGGAGSEPEAALLAAVVKAAGK